MWSRETRPTNARFIAFAKSAGGVKLFEYQAKDLFREYGIPAPSSVLVKDPSELQAAMTKLRRPVVLKSQVLAGGRGKAGGILAVNSLEEAESAFAKILGLAIGGEKPTAVLVEESFLHEKEMYLSVTLDRGVRVQGGPLASCCHGAPSLARCAEVSTCRTAPTMWGRALAPVRRGRAAPER